MTRSKQQKIVALTTNIIAAILGGLASYFGIQN